MGASTGRLHTRANRGFDALPTRFDGIVLDRRRQGEEIAGATNNASSSCGSWRLLEVKFQAPASERVLIRLLYRGAAEVFWDDVKLGPDQ